MNVLELIDKVTDSVSLRTLLSKSNVEFLDHGCYGGAYLLPDGRVLKVAYSLSDGTYHWIRHCYDYQRRNGKPGRLQPRVYLCGVRKNPLNKDGFWWAVMEFIPHFGAGKRPAHGSSDYQMLLAITGHKYLDLHSGNYGTTSDGRFVITDPASATSHPMVPPSHAVAHKRVYGPQRSQRYC